MLKNRVLMGSMHSGLEEVLNNGKLEAMAEYFAQRAKGGVGLAVTGGIAPNKAGRVSYGAAMMTSGHDADKHKVVTNEVHKEGGKIALQLLHAGRYAYHHLTVAPSAVRSPISMFTPSALSSAQIINTIEDFVRASELAGEAGYDGVEIMGSEGYLINQFIALESNKRTDSWGGCYENRIRLALEIVERTRQALGQDFIIIFRLSMLDLVKGGSTFEEVVHLAKELENAGVSIINSGIGWHEARIPTIATAVPRGGFAWVTKKLMGKVKVPLCTTNRINMPSTAEEILEKGYADMISMARPFLADPAFVAKAEAGKEDEINTCIGCNQACLDHVFVLKRASCLVNPFAGFESELKLEPLSEVERNRIKIAVVGAGPAGLACAVSCAERGIPTTLFEKESKIGGQFNLAKSVPGKEEFFETLRYFNKKIRLVGVDLRLSTEVKIDDLKNFTHVVFATGVQPRKVKFDGSDHQKVVSYVDVLNGQIEVGQRVAVVGAGGIGFDVCEFLSHPHGKSLTQEGPKPGLASEDEIDEFASEWQIDLSHEKRGGLSSSKRALQSPREIYLLQRSKSKVGGKLGKTTGWIHRNSLRKRGVKMLKGVKYVKVDDQGLHIEVNRKPQVLEVDQIIVCAGQLPERTLWDEARKGKGDSERQFFLIGGSEEATELDAKRAIDQGTRLAANIEMAKTGQVFNQPVPLASRLYVKFSGFMNN